MTKNELYDLVVRLHDGNKKFVNTAGLVRALEAVATKLWIDETPESPESAVIRHQLKTLRSKGSLDLTEGMEEVNASSKVFCGGLPWGMDDQDLADVMAEEFGPVKLAKVVTDKTTGESRGFGFVTFVHPDDAAEAIDAASLAIDGRTVRINEAHERPRYGQRR